MGAAVYEANSARQSSAELASARREQQSAHAQVSELERRLQASEQRVHAAEDDSAKLLAAIESFRAARSASVVSGPVSNASEAAEMSGPITHDMVEARYKRAQELARSGQGTEALNRRFAVQSTAKNIEALAGAGDLAHARDLAEKLLVFDASSETRALLQKHAERAGQPELLRGVPTR